MAESKPSLAVITGACGGMGQACARRLGLSHALVLTDIDEGRIAALAGQLAGEGYTVAATLAGEPMARAMARTARRSSRPDKARVRVWGGRGSTFRVTVVSAAKRPQDPVITLGRS